MAGDIFLQQRVWSVAKITIFYNYPNLRPGGKGDNSAYQKNLLFVFEVH